MWSDWLVFCDCGLQSACPLMEKAKRLMEASWWERLTEGETGWFWWAGHAQYIFNPIFCWRAGLCSPTPLCTQCPQPCSGHGHPRLRRRLLDTPRQVWVWVLVCTGFCLRPPRVCFPVLCKLWWLCGGTNGDLLQEGVRHTRSTQSPYSCGSPLLTRTSAGDAQTQFWLSLGPGVHKVCLSPPGISGGYGVWF